jgi:chromate reductase
MPLYNQDLEINPPPAPWAAFRQRIKAADAVLFVTPEYNRSVPAVLKNALDVGSRLMEPVSGTASLVRSSAAHRARSGPFGANHHLRQSLVFLNVPTLQQPQAYVGHVDKLFDEHGKLTRANSCRSSCWLSRIGWRRSDLEVSASDQGNLDC